MHYLTLLLAAAATASCAAVDKRLNFSMWCTNPIDTAGGCEKLGYTGYCCTANKWGVFTQQKDIALSAGGFIADSCEFGNGRPYCV
ncbi:hypothetical protein E4U55_002493 [Claviceps digitariae]|nr:hypothetical protein E4U55_002493 [Claviceps digitariae]